MVEIDNFAEADFVKMNGEAHAYHLNQNGLAPEPETILEDNTPKAHVDALRGVFITSLGGEIELSGQKISSLMLERITAEGKPKIPRKEVLLLGKHRELQANANDPDYLALMKEWEAEQNIKVMRYIFVIGAKGTPPQEFVDDQRQFFPEVSDLEMKYLWVASRLPDQDVDKFAEVVLGQGIATAKGLEEAANFST